MFPIVPFGERMDYRNAEQTIEYLRAKTKKTDVEDGIVKTWDDLCRYPFDYEKAKTRVLSNDAKYPDIKASIGIMPQTVLKPANEATEDDLKYNLSNQLGLLMLKAGFQSQ